MAEVFYYSQYCVIITPQTITTISYPGTVAASYFSSLDVKLLRVRRGVTDDGFVTIVRDRTPENTIADQTYLLNRGVDPSQGSRSNFHYFSEMSEDFDDATHK